MILRSIQNNIWAKKITQNIKINHIWFIILLNSTRAQKAYVTAKPIDEIANKRYE